MTVEIQKTEHELSYCSYKKPAQAPTGPDAKPLPKITIDGQVVEFMPGDTIMQAAERANAATEIPRYCYHPGMPIAGTCRMCTVEVEKAPKLMTSCSTPAGDGMIVHTRSEKVLKSRNGVMEFLLTNHPLDCPVCDKAGECELQDYNYEYGPGTSRFTEEKRVFEEATTKKLSDKVVLNMNRCVHCERCVRFTDDVTKTSDLVMLNRGWKKELTAADPERGLFNDYQGCLTDFCPVGALTWTDFRFQKRVWFLRKDATVCDGCAKGCNIEVHSEKEVAYRLKPVFNEKINGHWMCDDGRGTYHLGMNHHRLVVPMILAPGTAKVASTNWETVTPFVRTLMQKSNKTLVIVGTDATIEEVQFLQKIPRVELRYYNGVNNVKTSKDNKALDHLLRQSDRTPNTKGVESLGVKPLETADVAGVELAITVRFGRSAIPALASVPNVVAWGVWSFEEVKDMNNLKAVIPGLTTYEKEGTYINCDGISQRFSMAIAHRAQGLSVGKVVNLLLQ
jgi:NADH-quinone oxidoreductase subunit G